MKNRLVRALITSFVVSSLVMVPVSADPGEAGSIEGQKQTVESQAVGVNEQLVNLIVQFSALQTDINSQQERIVKSEQDLKEAAQKEEEQYNAMKLRIQYMYESGDVSFMEALLSAKSYSDVVSKSEYVQKVHEYDRKMLKEYIETKEEVVSLKVELEAGQADMQSMAEALEGQKTNMESTLASMREQIADFDSQLAAAQQQASTQLGQLIDDSNSVPIVGDEVQEKPSQTKPTGGSTPSNPTPSNPTPSKPTPPAPSKPSGGGGNTAPSNPGNASLGQQIANTACSYIGNPYVYGGTSLTNGADCSGFVMSVHRLLGISTPRDSWGQLSGGKAVSASNILPGDVIVYADHVSIYIGGGSIVHASNSAPYPAGGIKTSSPWNYRTVLGIRRYW